MESRTYTVKQNYFEPNLFNDIPLNNNVPAGVWDDPENMYLDINDFEDYQSYQPACEYSNFWTDISPK